MFSRAQGSVRLVAAVGESFRTNASQDSANVVYNALEHKQVWRCEQFLLLQQQGARSVPIDAFKSNLVARTKLSQAVQVLGNDVGTLPISPIHLSFPKKHVLQA